MKIIIQNADNEKLEIHLDDEKLVTMTVRDLLNEILDCNVILKENIAFEAYEQLLQLSFNGVYLNPNSMVSNCAFKDDSVIDLSLKRPISMDNVPKDVNLNDLTVLKITLPPDELICPITNYIFNDPVILPERKGTPSIVDINGQRGLFFPVFNEITVERKAVTEAIKNRDVPICEHAIEDLTPDIKKKEEVNKFFKSFYEHSMYHTKFKEQQFGLLEENEKKQVESDHVNYHIDSPGVDKDENDWFLTFPPGN